MRRTPLVCVPMALVVAGCSSGVDGPASSIGAPNPITTSAASAGADTTPERARAEELVADLYAGFSASSAGGQAAVAAFVAQHNHPAYAYPADQCLTYLRSFGGSDAYRFTSIPDVGRLEPDPGWHIPDGREAAGQVPAGDLYTVPIVIVESDVDLHRETTVERHVAVLDDVAYFFQPCEGDEAAPRAV